MSHPQPRRGSGVASAILRWRIIPVVAILMLIALGVINAGTPDQMVAWLDTLFLHGSTPNQMKQIILTAVDAVDPTDTTGQAEAAIYLYASSSMYQVQH